jgi:molybdate transport system substrate-binding protein
MRRSPYAEWLSAGFITAIVVLGWMLGGCESRATAPGAPAQKNAAPAVDRSLRVHAAASLHDSFAQIAQEFEETHRDVKVALSTAGSNQLRLQLEQGAPGDVFASADTVQMDAAVKSKLVIEGQPRVFAHNRLVIIVPAQNPGGVSEFKDLGKPGLRLIVAEDAVPVGRYTAKMLEAAGKGEASAGLGEEFVKAVRANVVSREQNVAAVVSKVRLGEGDAGIAYATDAMGAAKADLKVIAVPGEFDQRADYLIATLERAGEKALAAEFVGYVLGPGAEVLKRRGFEMPVVGEPAISPAATGAGTGK